ncbi:glycosyltransferase, partial [Candidatus Bathyarchaeota archaeon]|nr:glycosyltransferase [Candidatus Bathyarchaeota archaeon]
MKRSRGIFDKTLRLALNISRAEADIYHVHYLLQDCYLALKFGKHPIIGHAHGSDLRSTLKHRIWGRIVSHNLRHCEKVLVSTPDILDVARSFCENAEYLPNPVDTNRFY